MSTATATQNDDLIILSDNISSTFWTDPVISQDLNFTDNNSVISFDTPIEIPSNDSLITPSIEPDSNPDVSLFWESLVSQEDSWLVLNTIEETDLDSSTWINLEPQIVKDEKIEIDNSVNNLFWDLKITNQDSDSDSLVDNEINLNNNTEIKLDEPVGDMNSILNNTIDKLKKRQTWISLQKSSKITTINDLEAKIKDLRDQVTYLKKEIVFLDEENIKIDINVWNLESMRIWKQTKVASKAREHNTKKLTKQIKPV